LSSEIFTPLELHPKSSDNLGMHPSPLAKQFEMTAT